MSKKKKPRPHRVAVPKKGETIASYFELAAKAVHRVSGKTPSRMSLHKYREEGFPIRQGGPRVAMPAFHALNRVMTSEEAMERWVQLVRKLRKEQQR